jgi:hypothetical protein
LTAPPAPDSAIGPSHSDDALEDLLVVMETRQLPGHQLQQLTTDELRHLAAEATDPD